METEHLPEYIMRTLCRICAEKSSKLIPVLEHKQLQLKILKCLPIQVTVNDYLPVSICEVCLTKVDESYLLYETCLLADQKLKKLWKSLLKQPSICSDEETFLTESDIITRRHSLNQFENLPSELIMGYMGNEPGNVMLLSDTQHLLNIHGEAPEEVIPSNIVITLPHGTLNSSIDEVEHQPSSFLSDSMAYNIEDRSLTLAAEGSSAVLTKGSSSKNPVKRHKAEDNKVKEDAQVKSHKVEVIKQTKQAPKTYSCRYCPRQLSTMGSMSIHESTHSQEKPFLCDTCGKSFKHANNLRSHARTHLGIYKKFICTLCNKSFISNFFLQEHMNIHTGETPYECGICEKKFREKVHLRQHRWTHSKKKFVCSFCGVHFNRKGNMSEHIKKYHIQDTIKEVVNIIPKETQPKEQDHCPCPVCKSIFTSEELLKQHLKSHMKDQCYFCSLCGKRFRHSGSLTYHRRAAHTGERPFQCSYCDEKFSLRSVQRIHERNKHTFQYPYACSFCPKTFANSSSLKNHGYVHSKDKSFECDQCGKKFARSSNLYVHRKLHSNDRQFTCDECGKSYIQKHDMLKHKKVHDPKKKPFYCKFCGNSFSHKKDFAKHSICQLNFSKRNNIVDVCSAEKILDSVTSVFQRDAKSLFETERLILESVEQFSNEKLERAGNEEDIVHYGTKDDDTAESTEAGEVFIMKPS